MSTYWLFMHNIFLKFFLTRSKLLTLPPSLSFSLPLIIFIIYIICILNHFPHRCLISFLSILPSGLPLVLVVGWAVARVTVENTLCWFTHVQPWLFWTFIRGPVGVSILVSLSFFFLLRFPSMKRQTRPSTSIFFSTCISCYSFSSFYVSFHVIFSVILLPVFRIDEEGSEGDEIK